MDIFLSLFFLSHFLPIWVFPIWHSEAFRKKKLRRRGKNDIQWPQNSFCLNKQICSSSYCYSAKKKVKEYCHFCQIFLPIGAGIGAIDSKIQIRNANWATWSVAPHSIEFNEEIDWHGNTISLRGLGCRKRRCENSGAKIESSRRFMTCIAKIEPIIIWSIMASVPFGGQECNRNRNGHSTPSSYSLHLVLILLNNVTKYT